MAATTTIYLVRHGDVENPEGVYYGRLPGFALSELGREQARAAGRHLSESAITKIYASPQTRAQETARLIQAELTSEPPIQREEAINEIYSRFDGISQAEMEGRDWNFYAGEGQPYEQPQDILGRVRAFIHRVRRVHAGEEIVAVSHADPIVFYWLWALNVPLTPENRRQLNAYGLVDDYPEKASISSFRFTTTNADERPEYSYLKPY